MGIFLEVRIVHFDCFRCAYINRLKKALEWSYAGQKRATMSKTETGRFYFERGRLEGNITSCLKNPLPLAAPPFNF